MNTSKLEKISQSFSFYFLLDYSKVVLADGLGIFIDKFYGNENFNLISNSYYYLLISLPLVFKYILIFSILRYIQAYQNYLDLTYHIILIHPIKLKTFQIFGKTGILLFQNSLEILFFLNFFILKKIFKYFLSLTYINNNYFFISGLYSLNFVL